MSAIRNLLTVTNIAYLVAAIYFIVVAVSGQATSYSISAAVLCIVSIPLALKKDWFFSVPIRVATAAFLVTLFATQVIATAGTSLVGSFLINGILLLVFLGVLLSVTRDSIKKETEEEREEEQIAEEQEKKKREAKKLTYEV